MKIKKVVIPTITLVMIASQLMGCAAVSQSELLQMINNGQAIEIEVMAPISQEQGTESSILWEQLALLTLNPDLRSNWDDILGIIKTNTEKNGVLYVNEQGENEPNNTLRVALHNRAFLKLIEDEEFTTKLAESAIQNYADLDEDEEETALLMAINGYFNLLPDSEPNYANPSSTLQRNEFMAMIFRADTPVSEMKEDNSFTKAVGQNEYNIYAQEVVRESYLDMESKSLDNMTYNGTITRAEAVYLIVQRYFEDEYKNADIKQSVFKDAKDGGNIAEQQKFIEKGNKKEYWKSYELTYALQNPEKGMPTDLYKAMIVAKEKGIITDSESKWDEGLTRSEAVKILVNTYIADKSMKLFNFKQGIMEGNEVLEEIIEEDTAGGTMTGDSIDLTKEEQYMEEEKEAIDTTLNSEPVNEIKITEEFNKTMYAIKNGNIRTKDTTNSEKAASLEYGATIQVTGKTSNGWYRIRWGDKSLYVASSLLADSLPSSNSGNGGNTAPSTPTQPVIPPRQPSNPDAPQQGHPDIPAPSNDWGNSNLFG